MILKLFDIFKTKKKIIIFYWFIFFIIFFGIWLNITFGNPSFINLLYHLQFNFYGLFEADVNFLFSFIYNCLVNTFFLSIFVTLIYSKLRLTFNLYFHLLVLFLSFITLFFNLNAYSFILNNFSKSSYITENYISPIKFDAPTNKKNLILIYLESIENSYSDTKIFEKDLLKPLNIESKTSFSFKNYTQTYGSEWTIGSFVSTQCGIPLKPIIFDHNHIGQNINSYLPGVTCLGDILKLHGYKNIYMGGASSSFAGKGKFLSQHGYEEIYGKNEWINLGYPEKNFSNWGLYDDLLFEEAKKKILQLEKKNTLYNLTLLTLDTHHPKGFVSNFCYNMKVKNLEDIINCNSYLVRNFLDFFYENELHKNTNLVILGDHLSAANEISNKLKKINNRFIFNIFYSNDNFQKNREKMYSYSMFPTILNFLNFEFKDNKLGLGTSGINFRTNNAIIEDLDSVQLRNKLSKYSLVYNSFWLPK